MLTRGLKNNPNDWEMYREMAILYAWTERKPALALPYAQAGQVQVTEGYARHLMSHDDYVFAHNLMGGLCRTLEDQVRHGGAGAVTADGHPLPPPAAGVSAGRSRPSASG